ncbi:MAG: arylesterase [Bacteriovoracaceae bacterium]|nr:arylesterase [Bacteriovoracaceae bacterium]
MKACIIFLFLTLSTALAAPVQIICLGDSLTAGYGIEKDKAYPQILENKLNKMGKQVNVLNGGVSGSTTASGKSRLQWFLKKSKPEIMILALGANDGLRGLKLAQSEKNLEEIILLAKKSNVKILLGGMRLPPNYGKDYVKQFRQMYTKLKKKHDLVMIPFLLKDVGGKKELNIEDGIHPNEKGHEVIAQTIIKYLEPLL